jgi:molybdopterin synthase catalytic subunit/molybdopterin converting factor small subunit
MIIVKLFALLKDKAGRDELRIEAGPGTVSELLTVVSNQYPVLSDMISGGGLLISVNREFAKADSMVKDNDEVALMPPFSGGGERPSGNIRIQKGPFSLDEETERLKKSSSAIGAIVTFLGTTRDISRGKQVSKLEFEHYPGMAEKKLEEIRGKALKDYGVIDVVIIHRVGVLPVGENIVLIAVAARHRDEAFRACRFCIDELKRITPIWKRETTPEGELWVEEHP